jgi:hypothetical protein
MMMKDYEEMIESNLELVDDSYGPDSSISGGSEELIDEITFTHNGVYITSVEMHTTSG